MSKLRAGALVLALLLSGFLIAFGVQQGELKKIYIKAKRL